MKIIHFGAPRDAALLARIFYKKEWEYPRWLKNYAEAIPNAQWKGWHELHGKK